MKRYKLLFLLLLPCLWLTGPRAHALLATRHDVILYENGYPLLDDSVFFCLRTYKDGKCEINPRGSVSLSDQICRNGRCQFPTSASEVTFIKTKVKRSEEEWKALLSMDTFNKVLCERQDRKPEKGCDEFQGRFKPYYGGKENHGIEDYEKDYADYQNRQINAVTSYAVIIPLPEPQRRDEGKPINPMSEGPYMIPKTLAIDIREKTVYELSPPIHILSQLEFKKKQKTAEHKAALQQVPEKNASSNRERPISDWHLGVITGVIGLITLLVSMYARNHLWKLYKSKRESPQKQK